MNMFENFSMSSKEINSMIDALENKADREIPIDMYHLIIQTTNKGFYNDNDLNNLADISVDFAKNKIMKLQNTHNKKISVYSELTCKLFDREFWCLYCYKMTELRVNR